MSRYDDDEHFDDERSPEAEDRAIRREFADPYGKSALRAASKKNPRNLPCPTCHEPNRLTPRDKALHYQCDECSDRDETGGF
jgi:hypothetical protein